MFPFLPAFMDVAEQAHLAVHAEQRARTGSDVTATETEVAPRLHYELLTPHRGNEHLVVSYNPRFVYTQTLKRATFDPRVVNPETLNTANPNDTPTSALHNAGIMLDLTRPRYRISFSQLGAYGPVTTTSLLVTAPWGGDELPVDPVPIVPSTVAARFRLLFLQTQLLVPIRIHRRVALTPGFVFNAFGGADSDSRRALALTSGPEASLTLEAAATRNDRIVASVGAGRLTTQFEGERTGDLIYRAQGTLGWRHWYSKHVSTDVSAGEMLAGDKNAGVALYGSVSAGLLYDSYPMFRLEPGAPPEGGPEGHSNRVQVGIVARSTPWLDLFSGELEPRSVGIATLNYTIKRAVLRFQFSSANVFHAPRSVAKYEFFQAETSVFYRFINTFSGEAGIRYGKQSFDNAIRSSELSQFTGFVGLTWAPHPARF